MKNEIKVASVILHSTLITSSYGQCQFPDCAATWAQADYFQDAEVSHNGANYTAKYWTNTEPGTDGSWLLTNRCGVMPKANQHLRNRKSHLSK